MRADAQPAPAAIDLHRNRLELIRFTSREARVQAFNALIERGHAPNYVDLYTSTGPQNRYAAMLSGVLRFKNREAAETSVERINELYEQFLENRDRRGMHQCQVLALIGKNRAEGIGKWQEAQLFADWLADHLEVHRPEADVIQLAIPQTESDVEELEEALPLAA